jgi:hypothetical protein
VGKSADYLSGRFEEISIKHTEKYLCPDEKNLFSAACFKCEGTGVKMLLLL